MNSPIQVRHCVLPPQQFPLHMVCLSPRSNITALTKQAIYTLQCSTGVQAISVANDLKAAA
jgi:hypothetical protein